VKNPIQLAKARRYAEQIAERLQPFCTKLEIAGSIRRERPFCGDVDIVALPCDEPALRARITEGKEVIQNGPQNIHIRLTNGLEVQVFLAQPETKDLLDTKPTNWGSLLLLRTGSKEHNIFLTQTALFNCAKWEVYKGISRDGKIVASATEEEIFDALHIKFVPPQQREMAAHSGPATPIAPFFKSADA
jgi:DNA polymerase (family X)